MGQQKTENRKQKTGAASPRPSRKVWWGLAVLIIAAVGGFAWVRVGMLDLPSVPSAVTTEAAGLADLEKMKQLDDLIFGVRQRTGALQDAGAKSAASWQPNP